MLTKKEYINLCVLFVSRESQLHCSVPRQNTNFQIYPPLFLQPPPIVLFLISRLSSTVIYITISKRSASFNWSFRTSS